MNNFRFVSGRSLVWARTSGSRSLSKISSLMTPWFVTTTICLYTMLSMATRLDATVACILLPPSSFQVMSLISDLLHPSTVPPEVLSPNGASSTQRMHKMEGNEVSVIRNFTSSPNSYIYYSYSYAVLKYH